MFVVTQLAELVTMVTLLHTSILSDLSFEFMIIILVTTISLNYEQAAHIINNI